MSTLEQKLDELEALIKGQVKDAVVECHDCKKKALPGAMIPSVKTFKNSNYVKNIHTCPACFERAFKAKEAEDKKDLTKSDLMPNMSTPNLMPKITQSNSVGRPKGPGVARSPIPKAPNIGIKPPSKKDPVNVAQQLTNPDTKKETIAQAKEGVAFSTRGQWSLKKADEPKFHYGWVSPKGEVHQQVQLGRPEVSAHEDMARKFFPGLPSGYASDEAVKNGWMKWNSGKTGHNVGNAEAVHPDSPQIAGLKLHLHQNPEAKASMGNHVTFWDNKGWGKPAHTAPMEHFLAPPKMDDVEKNGDEPNIGVDDQPV